MMSIAESIKWHGGKRYLADRIIDLMPEPTHYTEPFAGSLSVLLRKSCKGVSEAVNDRHYKLANFWAVLADPDSFERFYRRVEFLLLSEPLFQWRKTPRLQTVSSRRWRSLFVRANLGKAL